MAASVRDLRQSVQRWMEKHDLAGHALWYSAPEWRDRREDYGNDAALTLVIDGTPMHRLLNRPSAADRPLFDEFTFLVAALGYRCELGYSWSAHFYPRPGDMSR
jgi:hypothetical protein